MNELILVVTRLRDEMQAKANGSYGDDPAGDLAQTIADTLDDLLNNELGEK